MKIEQIQIDGTTIKFFDNYIMDNTDISLKNLEILIQKIMENM